MTARFHEHKTGRGLLTPAPNSCPLRKWASRNSAQERISEGGHDEIQTVARYTMFDVRQSLYEWRSLRRRGAGENRHCEQVALVGLVRGRILPRFRRKPRHRRTGRRGQFNGSNGVNGHGKRGPPRTLALGERESPDVIAHALLGHDYAPHGVGRVRDVDGNEHPRRLAGVRHYFTHVVVACD